MTGLSSKYPLLLKQWDYDKNNKDNIYPDKVSPGSNKKVWWKCEKGHSYKQGIYSKVKGSSCPFCSNKKILKGYNDLETLLPDVAAEWNYNKNLLTPSDVGIGTAKKYWWICPNNHEYMEEVRQRAKGCGCPYCSGHRVYEGFNDLLTTHPELMKEWDYDKNTISPKSLSKGSRTQVWWKCEKGHSWQAAVYHRTKDRNCPICSGTRQTSFPEQAVYFYLSKIYKDVINRYKDIFNNGMELDVFIKDINVGIEYDGRYFHNTSKALTREKKKYEMCQSNNIKLIRIVESGTKKKSYCDKKINCLWDSGNYKDLDSALRDLFNYLKLDNSIINTKNDRIKIMELYKINNSAVPLIENKDLCEEWDYNKNIDLDPNLMNQDSDITVWWKCENGHSWKESISKRANGNMCPICARQRVISGVNDLATTNPELLYEWDYEKNTIKPEKISRGSNEKVWWICKNGHSWQTSVKNKRKINSCPFCPRQRIVSGINDLATLKPELLEEWDYEKNTIDPTKISQWSDTRVWWKCKKGHEWQVAVKKRTIGHKCPYCSNKMVLKGYNDLATTNPELLVKWDYNKNKDIIPTNITAGSSHHAWWKCDKGHSWNRVVRKQLKNEKCPYCKKNKVEQK